MFDDVFQLSNISRIVMEHEERKDLPADAAHHSTLQPVESFDKMFDQSGNIFSAFTQGGEFQQHHVNSVKKVPPEKALFHLFGQIFIGGGNDPYICFDLPYAAQGLKRFFPEARAEV